MKNWCLRTISSHKNKSYAELRLFGRNKIIERASQGYILREQLICSRKKMANSTIFPLKEWLKSQSGYKNTKKIWKCESFSSMFWMTGTWKIFCRVQINLDFSPFQLNHFHKSNIIEKNSLSSKKWQKIVFMHLKKKLDWWEQRICNGIYSWVQNSYNST